MKRCPTCQRTFTDETLSFCLDDGTPLLDASGGGPQSYGSNIKPPQSQAAAPTIAYRPGPTPNQATPSWQGGPAQPPRKRKVWPWILGGVGVLFILGVGFIVLIVALANMDTNSNNSNKANANNSNARASNKNNSNSNANATSNADSQAETNTNTNSASNNAAPTYPKSDVDITSLNMARDDGKGSAGQSVDTFSPSDRTVYCVVHLSKLKAGTKVKFSWYAVDAGGMENKLLKELDYTTNTFENIVNAHLTLPQDWPTGDYRVDVSVNDAAPRSVEYTVE
jgi:hypothetical protein